MLGTVLLVVLLLVLFGALPTWPHSLAWGCYPSGAGQTLNPEARPKPANQTHS